MSRVSGGDDDAHEGWVIREEDFFVIDVPPEARRLMTNRLRAGATPFPDDLTISTEDRELTRSEVENLLNDASTTTLRLIDFGELGHDELVELAQSSALLAAIWSTAMGASASDAAPAAEEIEWVATIGRLAADCEDMFVTRIRHRRDGSYSLRWSMVDRLLVREAAEDLRAILSTDDPAIARLFPSAYGSDADRNAGWDVLMRGELIERRLAALDVVDDMLDRKSCTEDELNAFMRSVNDARLVIGTRLDVDESGFAPTPDPSDRRQQMAYEVLTRLLGRTIEPLGSTS